MIRICLTVFTITLFLSGCLMPYQDEFTCNKGFNSGVCDSVSSVYDKTYQKKVETNNYKCLSCEDKYKDVIKYQYLEKLEKKDYE